jgi:uncharacterized protein DUF1579
MNRCTNPLCRWLLCALFACCVSGSAVTAGAADKAKPAPKADATQDQMMAEMLKYAMPGPQHEMLKPMAGSWKATTKSWSGPGDPKVAEGMCENKWILGGRYLESTYKGDFMGQPFEGLGLLGFDVKGKKYVNLWMDTMSTTYMASAGDLDPATKTLTFSGTVPDPVSGAPTPYRMVTKIVDDNKHVFSMYTVHDGKEALDMEITYTRM